MAAALEDRKPSIVIRFADYAAFGVTTFPPMDVQTSADFTVFTLPLTAHLTFVDVATGADVCAQAAVPAIKDTRRIARVFFMIYPL